jgi:hypothetical protein
MPELNPLSEGCLVPLTEVSQRGDNLDWGGWISKVSECEAQIPT